MAYGEGVLVSAAVSAVGAKLPPLFQQLAPSLSLSPCSCALVWVRGLSAYARDLSLGQAHSFVTGRVGCEGAVPVAAVNLMG